jgi:uncharacterized peroxidase-related enzyme
MSAWIEMIAPPDAEEDLAKAYETATTSHGTVDNVMQVHSLRPHTMMGHVALYRAVLHHPDNTLPKWFLEAIAVYTSILNECAYSLAHHTQNFQTLLGDESMDGAKLAALTERHPEKAFSGKYLALLRYTEKLTLNVAGIEESDIAALGEAGANDGEILETNQVCGYFNYVNRLLNGLGVSTEGDIIGAYVKQS